MCFVLFKSDMFVFWRNCVKLNLMVSRVLKLQVWKNCAVIFYFYRWVSPDFMPAWTQEINLQEHCKNKTKQLSFGQVCFEFYLGTSMQASKFSGFSKPVVFVLSQSLVLSSSWLALLVFAPKKQSTRNTKNKTFWIIMCKNSEQKKKQNILKKHVENVNAYIVHETVFVLFISIYLNSNIDMYIYIY